MGHFSKRLDLIKYSDKWSKLTAETAGLYGTFESADQVARASISTNMHMMQTQISNI